VWETVGREPKGTSKDEDGKGEVKCRCRPPIAAVNREATSELVGEDPAGSP